MKNAQTAFKRPLPRPRQMSLSVLESTGQFKQEFPTITLSYLGMASVDCPEDALLADIQEFAVNFEPHGEEADFELHAFLQPRKELMDFSDCLYIASTVDSRGTNKILQKIQDLGRYAVMVNTDHFLYRALVDDASGEVLESTLEYRYTN